jgi:hypothetical protein
MEKQKFYRVFDLQRGCYFATGYNATSIEELIKDFQSYILMSNEVEENEDNINGFLSTWNGISEYLQGVILEESDVIFNENEI